MIMIDKGKCRGDSGTRPVFWKRLPREIAGPAVGARRVGRRANQAATAPASSISTRSRLVVLSLFLLPSRPPVSLSFHLFRLRTADTGAASPCRRFVSSLRPRILDLSDFQSEPRRQTLRSAPVASHHWAGLVYGLRRLCRRTCCLSCRSTSAVNCRPQLLSLDPSARSKTKLETLQRSRVRHVTCSDPECGDWLRPSSAVIPFLRKMSINCPRRLAPLSTRGRPVIPEKSAPAEAWPGGGASGERLGWARTGLWVACRR